MKVHFEDRDWDFDIDEVTVSQARQIKRQTGLTLMKLQEGLTEADADSLVALYWLMKNQNGVAIDMNKAEFGIVKFSSALADAAEKQVADDLHVTVDELREYRIKAEQADTTVEALLKQDGHTVAENPTEADADAPPTT